MNYLTQTNYINFFFRIVQEERLYHHMQKMHGQYLLYFCKVCGLANSDGQIVYFHIAKKQCKDEVFNFHEFEIVKKIVESKNFF